MTAQASDADRRVLVRPAWLEATVSAVFSALGFDPADSAKIAAALVEADLRGVSSHGIMLVPMYVERLNAGGVTRERELDIRYDAGAALVVDALHLARTGSSAEEVRTLPDHWLSYVQLCDAPKEAPPDHAGLITEARTDRLLPGSGALPLHELIDAFPAGAVYSVEAPVLAHTGWAVDVRAEHAYQALRDTVHAM